jgi:hypothetical protein
VGHLKEKARRSDQAGGFLEPPPEIKKAFKDAYEYGSLGFPRVEPPLYTPKELLEPTDTKKWADVPAALAKKLGIKAGESLRGPTGVVIPRPEFERALKDYFLRQGSKRIPLRAFLIGGGPGSGKSSSLAQEGMDERGSAGYVHIDADWRL